MVLLPTHHTKEQQDHKHPPHPRSGPRLASSEVDHYGSLKCVAENARAVTFWPKILVNIFFAASARCTVCTDVGLESRCDSMIGSVRPKSSKRKAKGEGGTPIVSSERCGCILRNGCSTHESHDRKMPLKKTHHSRVLTNKTRPCYFYATLL